MDINNKVVLVLGGWGLVGRAICELLVREGPKEVVIHSLRQDEAEEACRELESIAPGVKLTPASGNIFVRSEFRDFTREELLNNREKRKSVIEDALDDLDRRIIDRSHIYHIITKHKPHIVIDAVNSATGVAYQDVFLSNLKVRNEIKKAEAASSLTDGLISETEKLLCTLYIPQLIRHIQLAYEAMKTVHTKMYVKIGTTGTGGMGLNIPYTHSEEKPSRVLLSKSSVAGAHTLLLFLMARTPDAPITKEIKPGAAIAWKKIGYGEIKKGGRPVQLFDCKPEQALKINGKFTLKPETGPWEILEGQTMKSVFIDTGENGIFSTGEFKTISAIGQMEFVTPEEIAMHTVYEIKGGNTGHDIINALDNATMAPTYRAGFLRGLAVEQMHSLEQTHEADSVAFELLGPPELSKLLYEAHLIRRVYKSMNKAAAADAEEMSRKTAEIIKTDQLLRSTIISVGLAILMPDGKSVLRGPMIKVPTARIEEEFETNDDLINKWAAGGWVDLRVQNMKKWIARFRRIHEEIQALPADDTSSRYIETKSYWLEDDAIDIGKVCSWIFIHEEKGIRFKS